jgi:hypothetical protein
MNWVDLGDLNDLTVPDYESCKCFNCKKLFWLSEEDDEVYNECYREGGLENSYYQDGKERPE